MFFFKRNEYSKTRKIEKECLYKFIDKFKILTFSEKTLHKLAKTICDKYKIADIASINYDPQYCNKYNADGVYKNDRIFLKYNYLNISVFVHELTHHIHSYKHTFAFLFSPHGSSFCKLEKEIFQTITDTYEQ